jgi:hypothetical protein
VQLLTMKQVKSSYRDAIDSKASDFEDQGWWNAVADEVQRVVASETIAAASSVIKWWHDDWSCVNDSPKRAAQRIRTAARRHLKNARQQTTS